MSANIFINEKGELVAKDLTRWQFCQFLASVWNSTHIKNWAKSDHDFWMGVAQHEFSRSFNEGWSYCESVLIFTTEKDQGVEEGKTWWYKTTSGTSVCAHQGVWINDEGKLPATTFSVAIPAERINGMTAGNLRIYAENSDAEFFSWGELFYSTPGTKEYQEARRLDMKIDSDLEKEKAAKRELVTSTVCSEVEEEFDYGDLDKEYYE